MPAWVSAPPLPRSYDTIWLALVLSVWTNTLLAAAPAASAEDEPTPASAAATVAADAPMRVFALIALCSLEVGGVQRSVPGEPGALQIVCAAWLANACRGCG